MRNVPQELILLRKEFDSDFDIFGPHFFLYEFFSTPINTIIRYTVS